MRKETDYSTPWENVRDEFFTPEEMEASRVRARIMFELSQARKKKKLTQQQLSKLSGLSQPAIARLESGNSGATLETTIKALTALGYTLKVTPIEQR